MMRIILCIVLAGVVHGASLRKNNVSYNYMIKKQKTERSVCDICRREYIDMRYSVAKDGSLYQYDKEEEFKTVARLNCHNVLLEYSKKELDTCLSVSNDARRMMKYLYDTRPSGCEKTGFCKRCRPCPSPAECIICDSPDMYDNFMTSSFNIWDDLITWINK